MGSPSISEGVLSYKSMSPPGNVVGVELIMEGASLSPGPGPC